MASSSPIAPSFGQPPSPSSASSPACLVELANAPPLPPPSSQQPPKHQTTTMTTTPQPLPAYYIPPSGKRPYRSGCGGGGNGIIELDEEQFSAMRITETGFAHMSVKVPFPESAIDDDGKCQNLIGRILGPRGISVRQLEMLYGCKILIRGKGSVKDVEKEKRLRGKPEGRHLEEKLHVLIEAQDITREMCARKLTNAKQCIEKLMVPVVFDEYKRQQLIQLAIINGTYRTRIRRSSCGNGHNRSNA